MTDEAEDTQIEEVVTPAGKMSFIIDPKKHQNAKLLRRLERETAECLDILMEVARDTQQPTKERRMAAEAVVNMRIDVADKMSKEMLNRYVLESKSMMTMLPKIKTIDGDDDEDSPNVIVDFSLIQSTTPVDLSNVKL